MATFDLAIRWNAYATGEHDEPTEWRLTVGNLGESIARVFSLAEGGPWAVEVEALGGALTRATLPAPELAKEIAERCVARWFAEALAGMVNSDVSETEPGT